MATKNIVPRANAQGQLGTDAKKWDKHIAVTGSFITVSGSVSGNELTLVSGSAKSTGSFGHILKGGVNWDTAVSTSAATAGFGTGGGSSFTAAGISGSWQSYSLISGSGQIATAISGAFTSTSSSLASRIETREAFTTQSFSDGTATKISGSAVSTGSFGRIETTGASDIGGALIVGGVLSIPNINDVSASLAAAVAGGDNLGNHTATTTLNLSSNAITNVTTLTATGNISSSLASTGSFGHILKGGVNWDTAVSKSAASAGFGTGGGGSSFTAAGISGSWQSYTLISGSEQIATQISGAFTSTSSSLASRVSNIVDGTTIITSASLAITASHALNSGVTSYTSLTSVPANIISGSAQIASNISGSVTAVSSSLASRITTAELELSNTLISGSAQIASDISGSLGVNATLIRGLTNVSISGSFTTVSSSLASRLSTEESKVGQSLNTSDSPTFAGLTTTGDITARNYIVSSSVTYMTSSFSSGSTIFGDDITDTHQFTGSVYVSGSLTAVNLTADSSSFSSRITTAELELGNTLISSSAQIATQISGSVTAVSSSFASRISTAESELGNTLISGSAQIASAISGSLGTNASIIRGLTNVSISGSFTGVSSSLASRITTEEANVDTLQSTLATEQGYIDTLQSTMTSEQTNIDNLQTDSGSFSTRLTTAETELGNTLISSSAQIASDISGSLGVNASVIRGLTNVSISGSFTTVSSSLASRITTREAFITQSFSDGTATTISGSVSSTGSFGHIIKGGVNWDTAVSASAATAGFGSGGGGSSFTAAGISGSWQSYSLISGSGQIATAISGAFTATSSSLASRITTREAFITQSFSDGTATKISGSSTSTGSFGRVEATKVAGTLTTAAQTNITSVGTLGGLEVNTSSDFGHLNIPGSGPGTLNGVAIGSTSGKEQSGAFTTVTTSGNISGSVSSTGSFGHIQVAKNFLPTTDNNSDLGSANKRWANIHSADLQLSNEGTEGNEIDGTTGNWTIQEGEDDLYLLNRKNGKKYRFKLQEID